MNNEIKMFLEKDKIKEHLEILNKEKVNIPDEYFSYLINTKSKKIVRLNMNEEFFHLFSLDELCKEITVDKTKIIQAKVLVGYAKTLKEFVFDRENTIDNEGNKFSLERLSNCVAIGFENTNILFFDPSENNSLYIFYPDGGDVKKLKIKIDMIATF